ncbi:MAG: hypothetical protein M0Z53_01085 [Thermaerobacter sp.]|nr:hypothetical protein [Thermaerobacter sp.]
MAPTLVPPKSPTWSRFLTGAAAFLAMALMVILVACGNSASPPSSSPRATSKTPGLSPSAGRSSRGASPSPSSPSPLPLSSASFPTVPPSSPNSAVASRDEAVVAALWNNCQAFVPAPGGCPFAVAATSDGAGRDLYAIDLRQNAGDACSGAIIYVFDGETLITDTTKLPPQALAVRSKDAVSADGPRQFAIAYLVNPSAASSCVQYGAAGRDTYVYRWTGQALALVSGAPPPSPEVLPKTFGP